MGSASMVALQTPSFRLNGRRALVTGASSGIGLAAAAALYQAGANVTLVARSTPDLIAACINIKRPDGFDVNEKQPKIDYKSLDVTDSCAVAEWIASEALAMGPFDILVNNAGTNRPSDLVDIVDADLNAVLDLNVKAAFYVTREVARSLLATVGVNGKRGSIINVSSQMGHVGGLKRSVYCATKHAIEGMTKALAWELGRQQIRVNTICPTYIETPMTAGMLADPAFRELAENGTALGRVGQLEEVMGAVVFLASDASSLITGSALKLDGGWTAR
jgi:NAD(P)-dependent dehydrogenase (short-subunit alcohol dehydrogenase family)